MPVLTVSVVDRLTGGILGQPMVERLRKFSDGEKLALKKGASKATETTRRSFKYRRDIAPPRAGRSGSGGQMVNHLKWGVVADGHEVVFAAKTADAKVPHWIIQEIGTGERAVMSQGPDKAPRHVAIRSQRGRRISSSLVFATGGRYSRPGASNTEQLFRAEQISGVPLGAAHGRHGGLRIKREIRGQHFVKKGGEAGFREYETSLLAAARQAFGKRTP